MPDDMGYIMRPVEAGMCKYESALDGTLDLYDFGLMNDYLDCKAENQKRVDEFYRKKR